MTTKDQFLTYEKIRKSGATNMFDVKSVEALSGGELNREIIIDIMHNYPNYAEKWLA